MPRGAAPPRRHVVRVGRRRPQLPRAAEVRELDGARRVAAHETVLGLDVAVEEAPPVHVREAREDVAEHGRGAPLVVVVLRRRLAHGVVEVAAVDELHDDEHGPVGLGVDDLPQRDDVAVRAAALLALVEGRDLALLQALVPGPEAPRDVLDGHGLAILRGLDDAPEGALAQELDDAVAVALAGRHRSLSRGVWPWGPPYATLPAGPRC